MSVLVYTCLCLLPQQRDFYANFNEKATESSLLVDILSG